MNDDLLVKFLLEEATETEQWQVQQWIAASPGNRKYFEQFELIWQQSRYLAATTTIDEQAAWQRFKQRVGSPVAAPAPVKSLGQWLRPLVAAAVLLLVATGAWLWYAGNNNRLVTLYADDQVRTDTLPDGSVVTLNKQSSIHYSAHFKGGTRLITLTGEGFFNVAPDADKPFEVHAGDAVIRVMGTSFNVQTQKHQTEVIVETGAVQVSKQQHAVQLQAHEKAIVSDSSNEPVKKATRDVLYNYYRTKTFVCNETPLYQLVEKLNSAYDAHIVIANERLRNLTINTTFDNQPLDTILDIIRQTFAPGTTIHITRSGNDIILQSE